MVWALGSTALATGCLLIFSLGSSLLIDHIYRLSWPPSPNTNDCYLFSTLCCTRACFLAGQTRWIAKKQCNKCDWHVNSSCAPEISYEVTSHSLVMLIPPINRISSHYCTKHIAAGACVIASCVLQIVLQHWALIALLDIAGDRHLSPSSLPRSNDVCGLFPVRLLWSGLQLSGDAPHRLGMPHGSPNV